MNVSSSFPLQGKGFQVLVVGGGINGVAIARECARRGKRVLLVEQNDFASGTTSRSTRIIHGGLRYLEQFEFDLVRESLRERERLLSQSPHLIRPMQFLLALPQKPRTFLRSGLAVRFGLWLYNYWAGGKRQRRDSQHAPLSRAPGQNSVSAVETIERQLDAGRQWAIYSY